MPLTENVTIAVDAMGGDNAPSVVLDGVAAALAEDENLQVVLVGPADVVEPFASTHNRCTAAVATEVIGMAEHPAEAVRKKKDSSIVIGCKLVKEGKAQGFFSAGSTGACLAGATRRHWPHQRRFSPLLVQRNPVSCGAGRYGGYRSECRLQARISCSIRPDGLHLCRENRWH